MYTYKFMALSFMICLVTFSVGKSAETLASLLKAHDEQTNPKRDAHVHTSCDRLADLVHQEIERLWQGNKNAVRNQVDDIKRGPKTSGQEQQLSVESDGNDSEPEEIRALRQSPHLEFILATQLETLNQLLMLGLASSQEREAMVHQLAQSFVRQGTDIFFPFPYTTSQQYKLIFDNDRIVDLQGVVWENAEAKRVSLIFLNYTVRAMRVIAGQQKTLAEFLIERDAQTPMGSPA
jgi:hypothetical protein